MQVRKGHVARSRQVCIYVVEALLIVYLFYLGSELILIDIKETPFRSSIRLVRYSWFIPVVSLRIATETRPIRNTDWSTTR
jgi:hypothetical protein